MKKITQWVVLSLLLGATTILLLLLIGESEVFTITFVLSKALLVVLLLVMPAIFMAANNAGLLPDEAVRLFHRLAREED